MHDFLNKHNFMITQIKYNKKEFNENIENSTEK